MTTTLVDLTVQILHRTDRAVLVTDSTPDNGVWLPLSQIEVAPADKVGLHVVTLPDWLAQERGLI